MKHTPIQNPIGSPLHLNMTFQCNKAGLGGPERCSHRSFLLKYKCYYTGHVSKHFPKAEPSAWCQLGCHVAERRISDKLDTAQQGRLYLPNIHTTVCSQNHVTVIAVVCLLEISIIMFSTNLVCQILTLLVDIKAISTSFPARTW